MSDFNAARKNMVDCQIHTSGVANPDILNAFETVPRENFTPKAYKDVCYMSEDLFMGQGRFILEPAVHARMLEALDIQKDDLVLDIGMSNGYAAAIFSDLVSTVVTIDPSQKKLEQANDIWNEIDACNIAGFKATLNKGLKAQAPYDIIFIGGGVAEIPENIVEQLSPNGRMVVIVKEKGRTMGQATLVKKDSGTDGGYSSYPLFEAGCSYLPGFEPETSFSF